MPDATQTRDQGQVSPVEVEEIGREFDEDACDFCDRYEKKGLSRSSRLLLAFLLEEGTGEKSVADLGCGAGGFSIELLKEGAGSAVGYDLSLKMIDSANHIAHMNGFESRAKFQQGNAATAELSASDIVIMDKVLCCYSEWRPLLKNAISASQEMVGFVVPRDIGIAKWFFRLGVRAVNYFQKRSGRILFYLHPLNQIDKTLQESGFKLRKKQGSRIWLVFLYSKAIQPES